LIEIVETLGNRKIGFCSLPESIDTSTPGGKLIFHVFGALAEFERGVFVTKQSQAWKLQGRVGERVVDHV